MAGRFARRVAFALLSIWGVATVTFLLGHVAPGDAADLFVSRQMDPPARAAVVATYALDRSLPAQYAGFLCAVARGDLGWSFAQRRPVLDLFLERLPATLQLTLAALIVHLAAGAGAGLVAAWWRGTWSETIGSAGLLVARS